MNAVGALFHPDPNLPCIVKPLLPTRLEQLRGSARPSAPLNLTLWCLQRFAEVSFLFENKGLTHESGEKSLLSVCVLAKIVRDERISRIWPNLEPSVGLRD